MKGNINDTSKVLIECMKEKELTPSMVSRLLGEDRRYLDQQIHRHNDMKVQRFTDVLEHMGYGVEVVDLGEIRKVNNETMLHAITEGEPQGLMWTFCDGVYMALDSRAPGKPVIYGFDEKYQCLDWLKSKKLEK